MSFDFPKHVPLCQHPTPIEKLERLSKILEGPQIYMKRDDLTGMALTGNKSRKLEFLLAEALEKNCDCVITCGGIQSNHTRSTAAAATRLGLKCHLVLRDGLNAPIEGNLFLDRLFGAEVEFVTTEEYANVDRVMQKMADELKQKGKKPYIIPEGGSNEVGALGYVKAAQEIAGQIKAGRMRIDHIILPVGSGGTLAGLLIGKYLYDFPSQIHGINVCDDASFFVNKVDGIIKKFQNRFDVIISIDKSDIDIIDGYVGKGYGLSRQEEINLIKRVALAEGIILDPVYTGKAMYGLADLIRQGRFKDDENILFLHTGGIFGIFAKRSLFF